MNRSYWDNELLPEHLDVVVIGAGIIGLSTAIHLKKRSPELKIAVLERGLIPVGASTKNAGFACFGSLSEIVEDLETMGTEAVIDLIRDRWNGLNYLLELTRGYDIGYFNYGGFELFTEKDSKLYEYCRSQLDAVNTTLKENFGQKVFSPADDRIQEMGFAGVKHMLVNPFEAQLNSGLLMKALLDICRKSGIHLLFGTEVVSWEESDQKVNIHLNNWNSISASQLVISTNGFARELMPQLEVQATRAQVVLTEPIPGLKVKGTFHIDRGFYYFRNIDNRVLLGGARNIDLPNEFTSSDKTTDIIQAELEKTLRTVILPTTPFMIEMRWTGTMGTGPSKQPIVERISYRVTVAVRMAGMGIAIGSQIGKKAADIALNYNGSK